MDPVVFQIQWDLYYLAPPDNLQFVKATAQHYGGQQYSGLSIVSFLSILIHTELDIIL